MWGDAEQRLTLAHVGADQAEVEQLEVAQPSMDQAGRAGRGAGADVLTLDQPHAQSAQRGVAGDPAADDPAADDQDVEVRRRQLLQARASHTNCSSSAIEGST